MTPPDYTQNKADVHGRINVACVRLEGVAETRRVKRVLAPFISMVSGVRKSINQWNLTHQSD